MKPVMMVRPPLGVLNDQGFWDEMKDAGIEEVAIQWLAVYDKLGDPSSPPILKPEDIHPRMLAAAGSKDARNPGWRLQAEPEAVRGHETLVTARHAPVRRRAG